jgi:hypothetical protein
MSTILNDLESKKNAVTHATDSMSRHKAILDFGESNIISLEGFLFGEYKLFEKVEESIERGLYNCATRAPSLGVHFPSTGSRALSPSVPAAFHSKNRIVPYSRRSKATSSEKNSPLNSPPEPPC